MTSEILTIIDSIEREKGIPKEVLFEAIESALERLTEPQRMTVVLSYYHGFRMREIGEIIGCTEGTARTHMFRALRRLRKELRDFSPRL